MKNCDRTQSLTIMPCIYVVVCLCDAIYFYLDIKSVAAPLLKRPNYHYHRRQLSPRIALAWCVFCDRALVGLSSRHLQVPRFFYGSISVKGPTVNLVCHMKKGILIIGCILMVFLIFTNPSLKDFKDYLPSEITASPKRAIEYHSKYSNWLIFSKFEYRCMKCMPNMGTDIPPPSSFRYHPMTSRYLGIAGNFYKIK